MAPKKYYSDEQMLKAIEEVRRGMKVALAATKFGVPRITLRNKITGKSPIACRMGPSTVLTAAEEEVLVQWILNLSDRHFPIGKEELLDSVQRIIVDQQRENPFTNNRPGKKWYKSFLNRHPEIATRAAQNLSSQRNQVTEENLKSWFDEIHEYLQKEDLVNIFENPARIFNADESAFFLQPKAGRVLTRRGEKNVYSFSGDEKENLTVLITANAAGKLAPPMIIFPYERIPSHIAKSVPTGWGIGKTDSGWMCGDTFYEYVTNIFNPWLIQENIPKPVLFFVDGHASHMSTHLSKFCSENGIELVALYPNSTHILQPMDLAVFRPLKLAWKQQVTKWKIENLGQKFSREHFAPVLQLALQTITEGCIKNGFRGGGLCPFGIEYIDLTKLSSHDRQNQIKTKRRSDFLINLESDIINIFSQAKLDLFNKLYYMSRSNLENILPDEDQSLYILWAKNKDSFLQSDSAQVTITDNTEPLQNTQIIETSVSHGSQNNDTADTLELQQSDSTQVTITDNTEPLQNIKIIETSLSHGSQDNDPAHTLELQPSVLQNIQYDEISAYESSNPTIIPHEKEQIITVLETPKSSSAPPSKTLPIPSSEISAIATTSQQSDFKILQQTAKTPLKKIPGTNILIPSPFKRAIFWPEENVKQKRRIKKEKIPSTITSQAWVEYNTKKENEKKRKLEEKAQRLKIREEKKKFKEESEKQKTKSKHIHKKRKVVESSESSSEDFSTNRTDTENKLMVTYAESASSDGEWFEEDDEVLELETVNKDNIKKGQFIVVVIKGGKRMSVINKFLCCIDDVEGEDIKITGMKAVDSTYKLFSVDESDSSYITFNQIVGLIQEEDYTIMLKGERLYYKFHKTVPLATTA